VVAGYTNVINSAMLRSAESLQPARVSGEHELVDGLLGDALSAVEYARNALGKRVTEPCDGSGRDGGLGHGGLGAAEVDEQRVELAVGDDRREAGTDGEA